MLQILDWGLSLLHTAVVLGNLLLWIPRRTLRLHLALVLCTTASWLGLGAFYGAGYCFLTDWHWRVKHALGEQGLGGHGLPGSFIEYSLEHLVGRDLAPSPIKHLTVAAFAGAATLSVVRNYLERRRRRQGGVVPKRARVERRS